MSAEYPKLIFEGTDDNRPIWDGYRLLLPASIFVLILAVLLAGTANGRASVIAVRSGSGMWSVKGSMEQMVYA